jgi:predicted phosphoribosyltransferase
MFYQEKPIFYDRVDAGQRLAEKLKQYQGQDAVVWAVPRGGVPVAIEVARKLGLPLDVIVTRKIQVPGNPEAGYGAVSEDGTVVLNEPLVNRLGLTERQINSQVEEVRAEVARRSALYRSRLTVPHLDGKTVISIDDGLASGYTVLAAVKTAEHRKVAKKLVAVPTASGSAYDLVKPSVDDLVCLTVARTSYFAVASFYQHWYDLTDAEVIEYLDYWQSE